MKRLSLFCAAFALLLSACAPTFLGENDPEYGAPKGGQLDNTLACAADIALTGSDPLMLDAHALPNELKGSEAAQASLHKLLDGGTNTWSGREVLYSLTPGPLFTWRKMPVRSAHVRMQDADGVREWSGFAVADSQKVWHFIDRMPRWTHDDTLAFYRAIDRPGDEMESAWSGGAGMYSLTLRNTDVKGNIISRNFSLRIGDVTVEGIVSRQEDKEWQLEESH